MPLDFATLDALLSHHPAWRLLRSDHAPLVASFLHRVFVTPNVRGMPAADLAEALEDELYALRLTRGEDTFPKAAIDYLDDWAAADKAWLRKYYKPGTDEAQFDLTPATEKALAWLAQLSERQFVGTESRLLTLFALLKQMGEGSETDPARRIAELQRKRDEIDAEMARVLAGDIPLLAAHFLHQAAQRYHLDAPTLGQAQLDQWLAHDWPGNVRDLRNAVDRFCLGVATGPASVPASSLNERVAQFERGLIEAALRESQGRISVAADKLQIARKTLHDRIARLGIDPERLR